MSGDTFSISDIFKFFWFGGGEKDEESEAKRGGELLLKMERAGEVSEGGRIGGAHRGWEGVAGRGGGGLIFFFFFGAEMSTKEIPTLTGWAESFLTWETGRD